jgi:hypothetical protein
MKKIFATMLLTLATAGVSAHGYYGGLGYRNNWVAPFVVGAGMGYLATRPYYAPPVYYYPPQVVYTQPPVYVQQPYSVPAGYVQQQILDANCNCYRTVLVPQ